MALKKPSDLFGNKFEDNNVPVIESDSSFRDELIKVESLSEQVIQLQQELSQKVVKNDLESLVLSQINTMRENFEYLQNDFKKSNKKDIVEFKKRVSELTEIVGNLVENELPKYKKQVTRNEVNIDNKFDELKEVVQENIVVIREEIYDKVNDIVEVIDNNLEFFNNQLQETSSEVKKTTDTYNKLSKIVESKVSNENEKLEEYSQVIQSLHEAFIQLENSLQEETSTYSQIIEEKFQTISFGLKNKIDNINENVKNRIGSIDEEVDTFKNQVFTDISSIKSDVVINEHHIKNVDKFLQDNHQELKELKEEVFLEIKKLPVGNLQENIKRLERKIDYIKETYSKIEPEVIVKEVIKESNFTEPSSSDNKDPLTPLDQNFVTLDQLQNHYRLFLNRIQQQLSTFGGGGETQLKYLDDIVGIATNASAYDGKFLKYDHGIGKFIFDTGDTGDGGGGESYASTAGISTVSQGLTGTPNINVGIVTATEYYGIFKGTIDSGSILDKADYANTAGVSTYATNSGVSTYATNSGIATYATNSGIATYATNSGVSTYATNSGIATYATNSGVSTYADVAGISTNVIGGIASVTSLSVSGVSTLGIVTASSYNGSGTNLTGIVTSIVAGTGVTISGSTGQVTINTYNITISTLDPTGGTNGDIWIKYTA